ncbi:hypothetical protein K2X14_07680 [Acetobacter sp. TBRC 12305]|uniref:Phage tail protein n=1 Tax=Acetobacter garciniae TaxID=2817435 RepID=A0A939KRK9_9PROT|nr:hypothetical protein [Acetobacter garciniae]MBO1325316.1 hypothetical protein [Acetobacter garciniae]MBX0344712.1 hypothetical protein [Acetobacter garciniae]
MAAAVKIPITAIDRASMTLDKVNGRIASLQALIRNAGRSLSRFFNLTGVSSMRKGMGDLSRTTLDTFRSVGRLVPEMGALTSAASVAGVYRLASAWAHVGTNLRTSSRSIGMDVGRHMALRNAAELSGGSADAMSGALSQLSALKWEIPNGYAPEAAAQFQALGISMEELKKSSPEQLFEHLAQKIRGIKNPAAQTIASMKIFEQNGQGLITIFQQSAQEFQNNIRLAQRYGVMNDKGADAAARMQNAQRQLTLAVEGFGYSVAEAVEPAITPVLQQMAEWIAANREWIAQDIAGYVRQLAGWLRNGGWEKIKRAVLGIGDSISEVVDKLGGWQSAAKDAVIALGVLWAAPVLAGVASLAGGLVGIGRAIGVIAASRSRLSTVLALFSAYQALKNANENGVSPQQQKQNRDWIMDLPGMKTLAAPYAWAYRTLYGQDPDDLITPQQDMQRGSTLMAGLRRDNTLGLNENAIRGVTAAGIAESHLYQSAKNPFSSARGAYQFIRSTRDQIMAEQGVDVWQADVDGQTKAALRYYQQHNPAQFSRFARASSPDAAMAMFTRDFLRPGDGEDGDLKRGGAFLRNYDQTSAPAAIMPASMPAQSDAEPGRMQLDVHVRTQGPPGTSVKTASASPNLKVASVTQHRAMDPANTAIGN